tara:strand:+ start:1575 stop:2126 length:552 start_codon:yes stop_codon:yes gene_type:complete
METVNNKERAMTKLGSPIRDRCQLAILTGFLVCLITVFQPATTYADVTLFTGVNNTTANRPTSGFAIGMLFMKLVGFELEYASALEDPALGSPLLRTGMANVVVETPTAVKGFKFYGTTGIGIYREKMVSSRFNQLGVNVGGGIKMTLAGPFRVRVDYRIFRLRGSPQKTDPKRLYVGLNAAF